MLKFVINSPTKIQNFKQKTKHFAFFFYRFKALFLQLSTTYHPSATTLQTRINKDLSDKWW